MTRDELLQECAKRGISPKARATKADLEALIVTHDERAEVMESLAKEARDPAFDEDRTWTLYPTEDVHHTSAPNAQEFPRDATEPAEADARREHAELEALNDVHSELCRSLGIDPNADDTNGDIGPTDPWLDATAERSTAIVAAWNAHGLNKLGDKMIHATHRQRVKWAADVNRLYDAETPDLDHVAAMIAAKWRALPPLFSPRYRKLNALDDRDRAAVRDAEKRAGR